MGELGILYSLMICQSGLLCSCLIFEDLSLFCLCKCLSGLFFFLLLASSFYGSCMVVLVISLHCLSVSLFSLVVDLFFFQCFLLYLLVYFMACLEGQFKALTTFIVFL